MFINYGCTPEAYEVAKQIARAEGMQLIQGKIWNGVKEHAEEAFIRLIKPNLVKAFGIGNRPCDSAKHGCKELLKNAGHKNGYWQKRE